MSKNSKKKKKLVLDNWLKNAKSRRSVMVMVDSLPSTKKMCKTSRTIYAFVGRPLTEQR